MTPSEFLGLKKGDVLICNINAGNAKKGLMLKVVENKNMGVMTITLNYVTLGMGVTEINWYIAQHENYDIINETYSRYKHLRGLYENEDTS